MGHKGYKLFLFFIGLLTLTTQYANAQQTIIDEEFSDGDFTNNPAWLDPENKHIVNAQNQLQLNAPSVADTAVISTSSTAAFGEWEFWVNFDFNPSSTSFSRLYLIADDNAFKEPVNGYFVRVGHTDDEVSLFRQDGDTETKIIDGTDDLIDESSVTVRIRVTRDLDGNWELLADATGGQNFVSEGTTSDLTYTTSNHIGIFSKYIGSRSTLYRYDDIRVIKESPPLTLQELVPENNSTLQAVFNIAVDPATVDASDFTISGGVGSPATVSQVDERTVQLNFQNPIPGGNYTLEADNIRDIDGNAIEADAAVSFSLFDAFEEGDIVINEFMYDPPGNLPEYVELRNTTSKSFNLQDWQLADNNSVNTISGDTLLLEPNDFLVISPDTTELNTVFGSRNYVQMSSFPALNNSGDDVKLFQSNNTIADSLTYLPEWGGSDVALERRSADAPSTAQANWGNSPAPEGGTPGEANQVEQDNTAPELTGLSFPDATTLRLIFSEGLTSGSAEDAANYGLTGSPEVTSATAIAPDTVQLDLDPPMSNNTEFTLSLNNLEDIFGNTLTGKDSAFTFFEITEADSGDVLINEFMFDPPEGFTEYVELVNTSNKSIDLKDWQFNDAAGSPATITENSRVLPPGEWIALAPDETLLDIFPDISLITMGSGFSALNNGGDQLIIHRADGARMDSLEYDNSWGGEDVALERRSSEFSAVFRANWGNSPAPEGGTPGEANQVEQDNSPPELASLSFPDATTLELTFSESLKLSSATDVNNYGLSGSPEVTSATAIAPDTVQLDLDPPMSNNTEFTLSLNNLEDIFGNTLTGKDSTFTFFEITEADSGDVLINEFMFDPPEGFTEYVELVNTSNKSIDLKDWQFNDAAGSPATITENSRVLPPGEWIALAPDETLLDIFPDISLITMGSGFSALNNGGDQLIIHRADGARMDSLEYDNSWGGEDVALERRSSEFSAVFRANWGNSPAPEGGTPGEVNKVEMDESPPNISSIRTIDARSISIIFTEEVINADDPAQYTLSPGIPIETVSVEADTANLQLSEDLISGITYTLEVTGLQDLFGNVLSTSLTGEFTFFVTGQPLPGELIINEFMYNPPDGYSEYIELFNTSEEAFDLSELQLNDNAGNPDIITKSQAIIPPGEWLVLAPDSTLPRLFPDRNFIVIGSSFPVLNNGGDAIKIIDQDDILLDSLLYLNSWGGDGVALERRSPDAPGEFSENWGDSPADDFGTPGIENLVAPDETPPEVLSVEALTENRVEVTLSERPDVVSATEPGTFKITPSRSVQMVIVRSATVELILNQPLETGQIFTLEVSNLDDLFGNTLTSASEDFELFQFEQALPQDIVVNEILYRKPANADLEFVELFNRSDKVIDLNLWQIKDSGGTARPIDAPGAFSIIPLKPQEFIVLTNNAQFADTTANTIQVTGFPSLNDDSDDVVLNNAVGSEIDSLRYNSIWGGNERGISLERIDPFGASNDPSNWRSSQAPEGSTPSAENSVLTIDNIAPQPVFATQRPDGNIEVQFSEFIDQNENLSFELAGSPLGILEFDRSSANQIVLESTTVDSSANPQITIRNLQDIRGNETPEATIPLSLPMQPGDVVINEIMFDPITGDTEDDPSQSEYLELFNRSNRAISLEGMILFEERLSDGTFEDQLDLVKSSGIFIPSGETFLIYADPAERFEESRISRFFGLDSLILFSRVDATSLQLVNSGQPVILADSTGQTVDSLVYSEEWHNPNLVDTKGISLERKVPGASSNDSENWGSASTRAVPEGGTPGQINTIFTQSGETERENEITVSPNPFSPNGDGKDDDLVIEYSLSETDFLLRVRIFDRFGREVRTLADGEPAGRSGTLIWDGRDDQGRENRIGYYIIHFKAFNSSEGNNKTFQETVVLARQL